ncbi:MAG: hypothetical protein PWQ37_636 [Candidatus Petromonas sp.]|nr:hypothetical protein [Candidatus Petromonas sp.]
MAKCTLCNTKKSKRLCPVINEYICPECCGSKRGVEINCAPECSFYVQCKRRENEKAIGKLVKESFNDEYNDLFKDERVVNVAGPFELYIFENYYNDIRVKDNNIYQCLLKMYYTLDGQGDIYTFDEFETELFNKFKEVVKQENTPVELQKTIILRLMKSIEQVTGGIFGNRNYMEMLRGQFTHTGRMGGMFL